MYFARCACRLDCWRCTLVMNHRLDSDDDSDEKELAALALLILIGAKEANERRLERRRQTRTYLCQPQLMPNPRAGTAWQVLYANQSDRAFITTMGVDCDTFQTLMEAGISQKYLVPTRPLQVHHDSDVDHSIPQVHSDSSFINKQMNVCF